MSRRPQAAHAGFTFFEILTVMAIIGIMVAIAYPRLRQNQTQAVQSAAVQMTRDLEAVRTRALGARRLIRVVFDTSGSRYFWVADTNGDSLFTSADSAAAAPGMVGSRSLGTGVVYGRGGMPDLPQFPGAGIVALDSGTITFDDRGLTFPARKQGAVYLTSGTGAVAAAVSVSGAGSFRAWAVAGGVWR
jgi:prepilin-type N-terminal cleavage/methylation domain-containing protein